MALQAVRDAGGILPAAGLRETLVEALGVTKRFPGVLAVDRADFVIAPGEIVALVGQNGAGKSTLIQILSGAHPYGSYEGEIALAGSPYRPQSISQAEAAGIALVPQEINIAPELSVADNMYLNAEPLRFGFIDEALKLSLARNALQAFGLDIHPGTPMRKLDLSTQQLVVIARALSKNALLLILDEPTAALTESEAQRLFEHVRALASRGVAIIFVSHRLAEVFALSHRIVVMRDGRIEGSHETGEATRDRIVSEMVGTLATRPAPTHAMAGDVALQVANLEVSDPDDDDRLRVEALSLALRRGEIMGLFGLLGAGCIETAQALYGAWPGKVRGSLRIAGREVSIATPAEAVALGLGLMTQDRRDGLIPEQSVHDNALLAARDRTSHNGFLDLYGGRRLVSDFVARLGIKTPSIDTEVAMLSGGNQQKIQVARWLAAEARIIILIDPTRGVDVGARAEIKTVWRELAAAGHAILVASTDTEELVDICDRVAVLRRGRFAGELAGSALTEANLLRMASDV